MVERQTLRALFTRGEVITKDFRGARGRAQTRKRNLRNFDSGRANLVSYEEYSYEVAELLGPFQRS